MGQSIWAPLGIRMLSHAGGYSVAHACLGYIRSICAFYGSFAKATQLHDLPEYPAAIIMSLQAMRVIGWYMKIQHTQARSIMNLSQGEEMYLLQCGRSIRLLTYYYQANHRSYLHAQRLDRTSRPARHCPRRSSVP